MARRIAKETLIVLAEGVAIYIALRFGLSALLRLCSF